MTNKCKHYLDPVTCKIVGIKYVGSDNIEREKELDITYDIGYENNRIFKSWITLENVSGFKDPITIEVRMVLDINTGDFRMMWSAPTTAENIVKGFKFDGKICSWEDRSFQINWIDPNVNDNGIYKAPTDWCGEDMYIINNDEASESGTKYVNGNLINVCLKLSIFTTKIHIFRC